MPRTELLPNPHDPSGMGRRLTAPNLNAEGVRILMKVCPLSLFLPKGDGSHPIMVTASHRLSVRTVDALACSLQRLFPA